MPHLFPGSRPSHWGRSGSPPGALLLPAARGVCLGRRMQGSWGGLPRPPLPSPPPLKAISHLTGGCPRETALSRGKERTQWGQGRQGSQQCVLSSWDVQLGPFITVTGVTKKGSQLPQWIRRSHIRKTGRGANLRTPGTGPPMRFGLVYMGLGSEGRPGGRLRGRTALGTWGPAHPRRVLLTAGQQGGQGHG